MTDFRSVETWVSIILIALLTALLVYNTYTFFREKVYNAYSTCSILLACNCLLLCRILSILYLGFSKQKNYDDMFFADALILDFSNFCVIMITLPIVWQWLVINQWLSNPIKAREADQSGDNLRRLQLS